MCKEIFVTMVTWVNNTHAFNFVILIFVAHVDYENMKNFRFTVPCRECMVSLIDESEEVCRMRVTLRALTMPNYISYVTSIVACIICAPDS